MHKCLAVAEMGDSLATIDMGRKDGAAAPLSGWYLGPLVIQRGIDKDLHPCQVAS